MIGERDGRIGSEHVFSSSALFAQSKQVAGIVFFGIIGPEAIRRNQDNIGFALLRRTIDPMRNNFLGGVWL